LQENMVGGGRVVPCGDGPIRWRQEPLHAAVLRAGLERHENYLRAGLERHENYLRAGLERYENYFSFQYLTGNQYAWRLNNLLRYN